MARKNDDYSFDFVGKPLRYKIMDGLSNMRRKQNEKNIEKENDEVIYFKTESVKSTLGEMKYIVFYNDCSFVSPYNREGTLIFTQKQRSSIIQATKGYIARNTERNPYKGWVHTYTVVPYDRAHSYPVALNLDVLIEKGMVLPLQ